MPRGRKIKNPIEGAKAPFATFIRSEPEGASMRIQNKVVWLSGRISNQDQLDEFTAALRAIIPLLPDNREDQERAELARLKEKYEPK